MKKIILLACAIVFSVTTYAQDCCNVVDGFGVTAVSSNGNCIVAPNIPCPDKDNDGVVDSEDECPDVAGTLKGCPDTDGDGIKDSEDQCPNKAGKASTQGCPDPDGDGLVGKADKCPKKAGTKKTKGCPDPDGDRVWGKRDKCPNVPGPKKNKGCPLDTDGDGFTDDVDKCPKKAGTDNGCPVKLTEEAKATLGKYAKTIQFNSGKSTFKKGVAATLDKVAEVMKEFPEIKFDVEGHSDSQGNDANNLKLSQARAQAVVDYLATHGIDGARLHATGYGEAKPIASNKTAAGRAQNRRVVLTAVE